MKINQYKRVQVDAKTLKVHVKVTDRFNGELLDEQGQRIGQLEESYVPDFFPGQHYGDYLILDIDINTGMITNWKAPTSEQVEEVFCQREEE